MSFNPPLNYAPAIEAYSNIVGSYHVNKNTADLDNSWLPYTWIPVMCHICNKDTGVRRKQWWISYFNNVPHNRTNWICVTCQEKGIYIHELKLKNNSI
jgi:hypothetical protein